MRIKKGFFVWQLVTDGRKPKVLTPIPTHSISTATIPINCGLYPTWPQDTTSKKGMTLNMQKHWCDPLKPFPLFLVPTIDTFTKQLEIMKEQQPNKHQEMVTIIAKS